MQLYLPSFRHAARVGDDLVVLDARAGRYAGLPAVDGGLRLSDGGATLTLSDPDLAGPLRALGFDAPQPGGPRPTIQAARRGIAGLASPEPRRLTAAQLARAVDAGVRYAALPFQDLLDAPSPPGPAPGSDAVGVAIATAQAFRRWRVWAPNAGKCLFRSYVLRRLLLADGVRPAWVFGVRTWPFAAHCWLQIADLVLDDAPALVSRYTAILAA